MSKLTSLLSEWLDPVGAALNAEAADRLLNIRATEAQQQRIDDLADRNTEGLLTPQERSEYETLVSAAAVINILQAKARTRRTTGSSAA